MSDPKLQQIHAWLKEHEPQLLEDNREMLRIPSVESEPVAGGPFGQANKDALMFALQLADKYGFKTKNMDGYIGFGEIGQGEKMLMSLGHLDVVPVSDGWNYPPFGAEIDGDYLYARGSCDDKGPTMASFYAVRAIKECMPDLPVRIRQVFGCNEESGFKCVEHYVANEEAPTMGIAPDSMWPLVYAEKGIMNLDITVPLPAAEGFKVLEIHGGSRPNIVIDSCEAQIEVSAELKKGVEDILASYWDKNIIHSWSGDRLTIRAAGKACHGSTPWEGDSAAVRLFRCIWDIAPLSLGKLMKTLVYMGAPSGVGPGIYGHDEPTQDLTANLGIVGTEDGNLTLLINVRYPVTWKGEDLEKRCRDHLAAYEMGFKLRIARDAKGLYFPLEHPLVQTVIDAYAMETGKTLKPQSMGGGTYARAVPNCVSIGACWDEDGDGKAHENDERMKVENLFRLSRIYANVLYKLILLNS